MNRNLRQHPAIAAANEFARNVMGDARILRRELKDDDISRAALEETAHFLSQLAQEMLQGIAPQAEQPGMLLASLGQRPPEAQPQTPNPEAPPSDVAALLQQMNNR
jgi:hypothetical protein